MSVPTMDVLPADSGQDLPHVVRRNLVDLGIAANQIAIAVNQASQLELQQLAVADAARALHRQNSQIADAAALLAQVAGDYHERLIVAFTLITTRYAVYAAGVATELAAGRQPSVHDLPDALPSTVIHSLDLYLPPVRVAAPALRRSVLNDQNLAIAEARQTLVTVIKHQMFGVDLTEYDSITAPPRPCTGDDLVIDLPVALHEYAGQLAWAIGVVTGNGHDAD